MAEPELTQRHEETGPRHRRQDTAGDNVDVGVAEVARREPDVVSREPDPVRGEPDLVRWELGVPRLDLVDWPALADDFYRLAHPPYRRAAHLEERVEGYGLAAALLGELLREGRIGFDGEQVVARDRKPSHSSVTLRILEYIRAGRSAQSVPEVLTVPELLQFVAATARAGVLERLVRDRHVTEYKVGAVRRTISYEPADPADWEWVGLNIALRINRREPLTGHQLFLAGLAFATNLLGVMMGDLAGGDRFVPRLRTLPADVQTLLACTHRAVTGAGGL